MRWGLPFAVVLLAALMPAGAIAQRDDGTEVAANGGASLRATHDEDGAVCLRLRYPKGTGVGCADRMTLHEPYVLAVDGAVGGAVVPDVTQVELEWPDGTRTPLATTGHAAFPGRRFFATARAGSRPWLIRYRGADGALLAVSEEGHGPKVAGPVRLSSGGTRRDGGRWTVDGWLERTLAPAPGVLDRTEVVACIARRNRGAFGTQCSLGEPRFDGPISGSVFSTGDHVLGRRDPHRLVLAALLGAGAASVDVHLGDGRRVRARVRDLSAEGVTGRFATYTVPARAAVRRLVIRDAAGKELDQQVVTLAPGVLGDDGYGSLFSLRPPLPGVAEVAAGPVQDGEGVLKVREVGARICAQVEGSYEPEDPCGLVPHTARDSLLVSGRTPGFRGVVGGVVAPEVAEVEITEIGGFAEQGPATVRVATQAPSPYAGTFAPHVRTFVALLPVGGLVNVRLLDAGGKELFKTSVFDVGGESTRPQRIPTRLRIGPVRLRGNPDDDCLFFTDTVAGLLHQTCGFSDDALVAHVACRPAVTLVVMRMKGRPGMRLRTARGRVLRPRRVKLSEQPFAFFAVPAPDAPRVVTWRGGRARLGPMASPREQCGYKVERSLR